MNRREIKVAYPKELPVSGHREAILEALRRSGVVIVCGDTGSGKTTQLPKMALELLLKRDEGRERGTRIACTQPRRLAAVTMAERVAEEIGCEVGGLVGYRHRFGRQVSGETKIEFMTDGVLLAETRFDPLLMAYDTIIVDEAHERSLNIDFLLGILKRIRERRRDLKVIISSATLDAERFSAFYDHAPTVIVPGRLYPITVGYRPPPEDEERDLARDVAEAVQELPARDDILVFLPGERDIRETADYLNEVRGGGLVETRPTGGGDDIIPLLASLPASEQRRAFRPSSRRRIILATNVAETSVTIPGIRAVIDSGLARISRYVHRTQVQRLQIEPISQASAKQRMGRCGRLGPGTCLRLYSEDDLNARDAYTPPEVLRSSLAGVILTMLDLKLGDIEAFPFIDPPKPAMIREGLRELLELGAIGHGATGIALTDIGRKLAKIPVEPRLARMLLAASRNAVLPSVLPLVAGMACEDPRRRPIDEKQQADQSHARFRMAGSDFLGTLKLWHWWEGETKELSQSKARKLCKTAYLSYPKMREWRDLTRQLETLAKRLGLDTVNDNGGEDMIHRSLLAGLLGRIGKYDEEERNYRGAHGLRFALHPGSVLAKPPKRQSPKQQQPKQATKKQQPPAWIVAGELVDTARLFAREAAAIDVRWLEPVAGGICKHSFHSPEWDPASGFVRATEQVTLYGLVIVPARRCDYSRIDPVVSREVFLRRGLVDAEFPKPPPPMRANQQLLDALRKCAERLRHPEFFDADKLFAHFNRIVPEEICSADALRRWLRDPANAAAFTLKKDDWWPDAWISNRDFPESLRIADVTIALAYRNTPDDPENDGLVATIRRGDVGVLRFWRPDWLVPGLLPEKVRWMFASLPSGVRRALPPLDETLAIVLPMLRPGGEPLEDAVRKVVYERFGVRIGEGVWDWSRLPRHLLACFRVREERTGKVVLCTRDVDAVLALEGESERQRPRTPREGEERQQAYDNKKRDEGRERGAVWRFGTIVEAAVDRNSGWETTSYLGLCDAGGEVVVKRFAEARKAAESHELGVTRLLVQALATQARVGFSSRRIPVEAALYLEGVGYGDERIASDVLEGSVRAALVRGRPAVRSEAAFEARIGEAATLAKMQQEMLAILVASAGEATAIERMLGDARVPEATRDAVIAQLAWLIFPGFLRSVPLEMLRRYARYLKGAKIRIERARLSPSSDRAKEAKFAPYWTQYREVAPKRALFNTAALDAYRWMLEEYRVSLFAQELRTPEPVSPKRLETLWGEI